MQRNIDTANRLISWYRENLVAHADLQKREIADFFVENFVVKANERTGKTH